MTASRRAGDAERENGGADVRIGLFGKADRPTATGAARGGCDRLTRGLTDRKPKAGFARRPLTGAALPAPPAKRFFGTPLPVTAYGPRPRGHPFTRAAPHPGTRRPTRPGIPERRARPAAAPRSRALFTAARRTAARFAAAVRAAVLRSVVPRTAGPRTAGRTGTAFRGICPAPLCSVPHRRRRCRSARPGAPAGGAGGGGRRVGRNGAAGRARRRRRT